MSGSGPVPDLCVAGQPLAWGLSPAAAGDGDGQGGLIAAKVPGGYNGPVAFDLNSWLPVDDADWERWTADGEGGFHTGPLPQAEVPEAIAGCRLDLTDAALPFPIPAQRRAQPCSAPAPTIGSFKADAPHPWRARLHERWPPHRRP